MLIKTVNFGELEVPEEKVIRFKSGIPGFPNLQDFALLDHDDFKPFQYLQGLGSPPVALLVINPFLIDAEYQFQLSAADMEEISASRVDEVVVLAVATIPHDPANTTINLMAPVVIHEKARLGKQVILHDSRYSVKHPLFNPSRSHGSETKVSGDRGIMP